MAEITAIGAGVFLAVLGINAWHSFPPDLSQIAEAAVSRKAIFLTVSGALMSLIGALRFFGKARRGRP